MLTWENITPLPGVGERAVLPSSSLGLSPNPVSALGQWPRRIPPCALPVVVFSKECDDGDNGARLGGPCPALPYSDVAIHECLVPNLTKWPVHADVSGSACLDLVVISFWGSRGKPAVDGSLSLPLTGCWVR